MSKKLIAISPLVSPVSWPPNQPKELRASLLKWYKANGRHNLPWVLSNTSSKDINDYYIVVSEVMMQQTTVAVGLKRFPLWISQFPTWKSLALATDTEVMKAWEGLGYYARARSLHKMAKAVIDDFSGHIPSSRSARLSLPGVGPTTASALGAFVYGLQEPIWDTNVSRVWQRWWGKNWPQGISSSQLKAWIWEMSQEAMPKTPIGIRQWSQSLMDLGATICTAKSPKCSVCPFMTTCQAFTSGFPESYSPSLKKSPILSIEKRWVWTKNKKGEIAVIQPLNSGIWPGLWQLPELKAGSILFKPSSLGTHKLTHRLIHWSITQTSYSSPSFYTKNLENHQLYWVTLDQWKDLPLPQPLRKWWDKKDTNF